LDHLLAFGSWLGDQIIHVERPEPIVKPIVTKGRTTQRKNRSAEAVYAADGRIGERSEDPIDATPERDLTKTPVRDTITVSAIPPEVAERVPLEDRVYDNYVFPSIKLLSEAEANTLAEPASDLKMRAQKIEQKLADFNIQGHIVHYRRGPVVTLFEFEPAPGVKVGRITSLQDDLAMSLRASVVRIVAPLPGKGTVGIEVPNHHRDVVRLREVIESDPFSKSTSLLSIPIGKDISGVPVVVDIASMPHLLIAGATGTGKSVCINSILVSLLYKAAPRDVGLILIDPKILELSVYEGIPHLRVPVVTVPRQAKAVLDWAVKEMDRRYRLMQRYSVRNIDSYNRMVSGEADPENDSVPLEDEVIKLEEVIEPGTLDVGDDTPERIRVTEKLEYLPKIVIVIDELADLMLQVGRDIEELITRLAQKARAAGIHLILATQRPSVDVITGLIKANFPARLSFRVTSRIDSRTILDSMGAERLLGKGDMLFMSPGANPLRRVHGAFVSDAEVKRVVNAIKSKDGPCYDAKIVAICDAALTEGESGDDKSEGGETEYDPFYDKAVELVIDKQQASTSMVQRVFRIGYNRAARMVERMERDGIVGPMDGVKQREVLVTQRDYGSETE
jgi:S-DNA-T family DNA segregation ATPase FtsK/SpoIIIE